MTQRQVKEASSFQEPEKLCRIQGGPWIPNKGPPETTNSPKFWVQNLETNPFLEENIAAEEERSLRKTGRGNQEGVGRQSATEFF
jgi:hypothetical protein